MNNVKLVTDQLVSAYLQNKTIDLEFLTKLSFTEAYQVQSQVSQALGFSIDEIKHWKVGAGSVNDIAISAPIYPNTVYSSEAIINASHFHSLEIELEWAFELAKPISIETPIDTLGQLSDAVANVYCAFELVDSRLNNWKQQTPQIRLADNQVTAGIVLGDEIPPEVWRQPENVFHQIEVDGKAQLDGSIRHPLGNPLTVIQLALPDFIRRVGVLKSGQIITTGSWNGLLPVSKAKRISGYFNQDYQVGINLVY